MRVILRKYLPYVKDFSKCYIYINLLNFHEKSWAGSYNNPCLADKKMETLMVWVACPGSTVGDTMS